MTGNCAAEKPRDHAMISKKLRKIELRIIRMEKQVRKMSDCLQHWLHIDGKRDFSKSILKKSGTFKKKWGEIFMASSFYLVDVLNFLSSTLASRWSSEAETKQQHL